MKKSVIGGLLCGAVVLSSALMFSGCGRVQINAGDYVDFTFSGYDNYGTASAHFDYSKMMKDNPEAFGLDKGGEVQQLKVELDLDEAISGKLDKTSDLKNGDTVTYEWDSIDTKALEKSYKVKFTFEDKTATVKGLKAAEDYDPFGGVTLSFSGFDGKGTATFERSGDGQVTLKIDQTNNGKLSNGDKIKVTVSGNTDDLKEALLKEGKNLTVTEKEFTVEGLEAYKEVDPFDYLKVTFTGTSPEGEATVKQSEDCPINYIEYDISKTSGISNGDTVKVTVTGEYESAGFKLTETEKEFTCEGLPYYISEISQLPDDVINKMKENNKDIMDAHVASDWKSAKEFSKMNFRGCYLLTPKEDVDWGYSSHINNKLIFVYKVTTTSKTQPDYYWCTGYSDIMVLDDGTITYDKSEAKIDSVCPYISIKDIGSWGSQGTYGYEDLDTLFNKVITANIDKYKYESTVKE